MSTKKPSKAEIKIIIESMMTTLDNPETAMEFSMAHDRVQIGTFIDDYGAEQPITIDGNRITTLSVRETRPDSYYIELHEANKEEE